MPSIGQIVKQIRYLRAIASGEITVGEMGKTSRAMLSRAFQLTFPEEKA